MRTMGTVRPTADITRLANSGPPLRVETCRSRRSYSTEFGPCHMPSVDERRRVVKVGAITPDPYGRTGARS